MSEITDEDVDAMAEQFWGCGGDGRDKWRAAAKEIERRVLARVKVEPRPMHEPVTDEEVRLLERAALYKTTRDAGGVREVLERFLSRRAAATRAEVVVTEAMIDECINRQAWSDGSRGTTVRLTLEWLADRLNNRNEKPVDPRRKMIETIINDARSNPYDITTDEIVARIIAKLDEVKP